MPTGAILVGVAVFVVWLVFGGIDEIVTRTQIGED
jgi:hypothetical protein